ncbi:hypothetical protein [Ciceribacter sp. L1K22]|uniref:hypothetical protein n=1 Tax=Ciceribacter sp. L1K22 TaxID=2820275 RepID=UPI001ABE26E4|nr:hypothetical protein [Ciceribacter sp. L1K22]MBO3760404.1 hypothetical protein [Ciceribacter sp. L1K22]
MFDNIFRQLQKLRAQRSTARTGRQRSAISGEDKIRFWLSEYRRNLRKAGPGAGALKGTAVAEGRFAKRKSRQVLKTFKKGKRNKVPMALLIRGKYGENKLASGLMPNRRSEWVPVLKRKEDQRYQQLVLQNFNFIDFPEETIEQLKDILDFEANAVSALLHFDDEYCSDVAAYLVLAEMWPQLSRVFRGGRMTLPIQKVIEALRLRRDLGMKLPDLADTEDVWAFPRRVRRASGSSRSSERHLEPQSREKVVDEFCDALDAWLGTAADELELTTSGKSRFASIIGELLDNAERHSDPPGKDGGWSVAAFMARRKEEEDEVYRCHLGFLSVGASMAESLRTASVSTRATINKYTDSHRGCGISADTLTTLVGLQDGITRDHAAATFGRGGVGLQEVLELISVLGVTGHSGREPRMTIVSGRSCIRARSPYLVGQRKQQDDPRVQWFNEDNSPHEPPDSNFVFDLNSRFPGTIIGVTFVLSKNDLMAVLNATDRAD